MRKRPEDELQRSVLEMCNLRRVDRRAVYFHVPNGGGRSKTEAAILKGLGVRAGAPDLLFLTNGGCVRCLELKAPSGRLSSAQQEFRRDCLARGIPYEVAEDLEQAAQILGDWGLFNPTKHDLLVSTSPSLRAFRTRYLVEDEDDWKGRQA